MDKEQIGRMIEELASRAVDQLDEEITFLEAMRALGEEVGEDLLRRISGNAGGDPPSDSPANNDR